MKNKRPSRMLPKFSFKNAFVTFQNSPAEYIFPEMHFYCFFDKLGLIPNVHLKLNLTSKLTWKMPLSKENTPGSSKNFATQLGKKLPPANTMKNQGEEPNSCSRETFSSARNSREKKMKQMTLTRNDSTPRHTTKKRTTQMSPSSNVSTPLQPEDIKGGDATECTLSQLSNIAVELLNGRVDCGFNTITSTCPKQPVGSKTKIDFQQEILVSQILPL